jgi:antitoxin component YwqK of YwqJK toxin-antitoxin module
MIKQKIISLFIFTIILTSVSAQTKINQFDEKGERHGVWRKNYPKTNQLRYEGKFFHGKEIDTFKYYKLKRKKSVLSAIKVFNPDNAKAEVVFMTSKGNVVSQGQMDGRNYIGKWLYYHKDSNKIMIEEYFNKEGLLEGTRTVYFTNGKVAEVAEYKSGKLNGLSKTYGESGKLLQESTYANDKLNGPSIYYNLYGQTKAKGEFKNNLKTGIWEYYVNGVLNKKVDHDIDKIIYKKQ